jgi:hypothetical protein
VKQGTTGEARVHVDAVPEKVYDIVSDVTRMGEWSPETTECEWLDGATGPAVGARFKGKNKRGIITWSTKPSVSVADPGREFSFVVGNETRWTYRFEPDSNGTQIIETFELLRDMRWYEQAAERVMLRGKDRRLDLEAGMAETLARIKAVVESEHRAG